MNALMNIEEFEKIGNMMFDGTRWGVKMASETGLSVALVSNIRRGIASISNKTEAKIKAAYDRFKRADGYVDADGTSMGGDASFGIQLVIRDLVSNKFVGIHNVDPKKFFPEFAPATEIVNNVVNNVVNNPSVSNKSPEVLVDADAGKTDEEILIEINDQIEVMDDITQTIISGHTPSQIVYGAPGVGKTYTIMKALDEAQVKNPDLHVDIIKGSVRAPGLFQALYKARNGGILVLDDTDSIFRDEEALNVLKAALDSSDQRIISWRKESAWIKTLAENEGVDISDVRDFEFNGGVIFITNINLKKAIKKGDKMAEHFRALVSRSYYVDLPMDGQRARLLRVSDVFLNHGMASSLGLDDDAANEIVAFMSDNQNVLEEISLRMAKMIVNIYTAHANWKKIVLHTKSAI